MFFDQLDERNMMVKSVLAFEEVSQGSAPEKSFVSPNC
jgi:hypothetical protein